MDDVGVSEVLLFLLGLAWLALWVWLAYLTAKKGHWLLFVLGFFCGGLFWVIGALLPDKRVRY